MLAKKRQAKPGRPAIAGDVAAQSAKGRNRHDRGPAVSPSAPVAIVGTGLIGRSWAICFARRNHQVRLFDHVAGAADRAAAALHDDLTALAAAGLLDGQDAAAVGARISVARSLETAVADAGHVQENTPEDLAVKRQIFAQLDRAAPPDAVLASSTSALLPSRFSQGLTGAARCLVAHPLNPPHLIPAVEIVPAPDTAPGTVAATAALMRAIGQQPIVMAKEIDGFVMNRLQGAVLDEAMTLVAQGYCSIADVDAAMRDGLARRWSFMGPFETIDLNAPGGVSDFFRRYGAAYAEIGRQRPNRHAWQGALAERVTAERREALALHDLPARQAWRDARLAALARHILDQNLSES